MEKYERRIYTSRITSNQRKFNDPLKRFNVKTFKTFTKYVVKCKHVQATVEVNRNILGSLLAFSISKESAIDLALKDPKTDNLEKEIKEDATFVTDLIAAI